MPHLIIDQPIKNHIYYVNTLMLLSHCEYPFFSFLETGGKRSRLFVGVIKGKEWNYFSFFKKQPKGCLFQLQDLHAQNEDACLMAHAEFGIACRR